MYGAIPLDYHHDFVDQLRRAEPHGLDAVISGVMNTDYVRSGLSLLRNGGTLVVFGEPDGFRTLFRVLGAAIRSMMSPVHKTIRLYGTSFYFLGQRQPFLDDWAVLFGLLAERRIQPVIASRFPLLQAAQANALLESGSVTGNIVLVSPELL